MTDINKTIKDIEECLSASCRGYKPKVYCPHTDEEWDIMRDALSVIRELKAENERLRQEKDDAVTVIQDLKEEIKELRMTARG